MPFSVRHDGMLVCYIFSSYSRNILLGHSLIHIRNQVASSICGIVGMAFLHPRVLQGWLWWLSLR